MAPAPLTSASVAMAAQPFPLLSRPAQWVTWAVRRSTRKWRPAGAPSWARGAGAAGGRVAAAPELLALLLLALLLVPEPCQPVSAQQ